MYWEKFMQGEISRFSRIFVFRGDFFSRGISFRGNFLSREFLPAGISFRDRIFTRTDNKCSEDQMFEKLISVRAGGGGGLFDSVENIVGNFQISVCGAHIV